MHSLPRSTHPTGHLIRKVQRQGTYCTAIPEVQIVGYLVTNSHPPGSHLKGVRYPFYLSWLSVCNSVCLHYAPNPSEWIRVFEEVCAARTKGDLIKAKCLSTLKEPYSSFSQPLRLAVVVDGEMHHSSIHSWCQQKFWYLLILFSLRWATGSSFR